MYLPNQELLSQVDLVFYNGASVETGTLELANVLSGANQRTLLAATPEMEVESPRSRPTWSTAAPRSTLRAARSASPRSPDSARSTASPGAPHRSRAQAHPELAIPDGTSLVRDIGAGCNTLLERSDDTGSSLADFSTSSLPTPQPNSEAGFNSSCPNTQIRRSRRQDHGPHAEVRVLRRRLITSATWTDRGLRGRATIGVLQAGQALEGQAQVRSRATETDGSVDGTPGELHLEDRQEEVAGSRPAQASRIQPRWYGRSVGLSSIGPRRPLNAARPTDDVAVLA